MKVLFVNPPNTLKDVLGKAAVFVSDFEPLGLLYIAAVLEREGIDVEVLDAYLYKMNLDDICRVVETKRPDVVGISCLTANASVVYVLGKRIKENFANMKVVLGNLHASFFSDVFLKNNVADFVVHEEGEYTMLELIRAIEGEKRDFSGVKGLSWLDTNRRVVNNEPRPLLQNLDELPMPARHLVPMSEYKATAINNYLYVIKDSKARRSMFTSRGCVFPYSFKKISCKS